MTDFITANLAQGIRYIDDSEVIIDTDTIDVFGEITFNQPQCVCRSKSMRPLTCAWVIGDLRLTKMYDGLPVRHFSDGLEVHPTANYRNSYRPNPKDIAINRRLKSFCILCSQQRSHFFIELAFGIGQQDCQRNNHGD